MKKVLSILLVLAITLVVSVPVFAGQNSINGIRSLKTQAELVEYATNIFPKHLHALVESGDLNGPIEEYSFGEPFTVFNVKENTNSSCFPVLQNEDIVAILEISENQGEYYSSLSVSFARELEDIIDSNMMRSFVLLTDGVHLQAFDGENSVEIFKLYDDGNKVEELSSDFTLSLSSLSKILSQSDLQTELRANDFLYSSLHPTAIYGPASYKTLEVRGVSQGNHPWCWAATCAAMINHLKGRSLSASDVANYVFPNNPEQGATWSGIKKAYNHWGLYPSQTGTISFTEVKSDINSNKPMHLGLNGHSVGLIGYEDWVGSAGGNNDRILILLEPNGGVHKSVALNSSGNFTYSLGGGRNAWKYTRRF
jgi:hypothetical protein